MYQEIDNQQLEQILKSLTSKDLIVLTLVDGDNLLGGIFKHWRVNKDSTGFQLSFNTHAGKTFGESVIVKIPFEQIADITKFPLVDSVISGLYVSDYPNPLAKIIYKHNQPVISSHQFEESFYVERAFSSDAIPSEGFDFDPSSNILLYADWSFFNNQSRGHTSLGVSFGVNIGKIFKSSLEEQVFQLLRRSLTGRVVPKISPKIGSYDVIEGSLLVAEPNQDDVIEGDDGDLYMLAQMNGDLYPVFLKRNYLKYPKEFLKPLNSRLTI